MPPSEPPKGTQSRGRRRRRQDESTRARAQQNAYVSQGRAVQRVARQQRAAQPRPLQAAPPQRLHRAQAPRAVRDIREAQNRPFREVARAAQQTRRARPLSSRPVTPKRIERDRSTLAKIVAAFDIYGFGKRSGPTVRGGATASLATTQVRGVSGGLPMRAATATGKAIAEKPSLLKDVPPDLGRMLVGAPAGLVETVAHPRRQGAAAIRDYARRYGPLASGDERAFIDRVKKEGVTPELVDLGSGASAGGAVTGRAIQAVARQAPRGSRLARIATERPALRVSGNVVREQEVSPNFFRNATRAALDRRRQTVQTRRARAEDAPLEVRQAQERGEVTYVSRRRQQREQRLLVAREKGVNVQRLKAEQQRETGAATRNLNSLSAEERRGFAFAHQFGATAPDAARRLLERRQGDIAAHRAQLAQARPGYTVSRRRDQLDELDWLHQNAEKVFTPRLRKVVREEQARERKVAAGDPGVDLTQAQLRRYQPVAAALGIERHEGETHAQFLRRVSRTAREHGLERPGYLRSEERARGVFAAFALGGRKATDLPKAYTGSLLRQGIESMDPNVHVQGIARGLKRRQQWNVVARNLERHAVDQLAGKSMRQRDIVSLTRDLENAGVDLKSVAFWNPRRFYEESRRAARDTEGADFRDARGEDVEHGSADVHTALQRSIVSPAEVRGNPEAFAKATGFSVVPAEVLKEIEGDTRPSGLGGRAVDIARGKVSRVLLGNPAWLTFQVASNAFLSGLAGAGPIDAVKAQRWWRGLSDAEREALAPEIGVHGWHDEQTRLGSTANSHFVNAYRAFKTTGLYQRAHKANPLDAIFRADNAQNNLFRKAVFYNQAKREAYRRMGDNATRMMRAQQSINRLLKLDPQERITAAAKDPKAFEHHARAVRDFLGDYTSYTSKERRTLGRYALFYGFLRHSLRLTFYTLPVKHPLITAIGLELGRLHGEELRRIFGVEPPVWEEANAYIKVGDGTRKFAIGRLNPFFNAAQYQGPGSLTMLGSPLMSMALDQVASKNVAFDRPWTVGGSGSYVERGRDVTGAQRARIAVAQALSLSPYYRFAEKTGIPGVADPLRGRQTDESSLLFPDPVQYRTPELAARNAQRAREQGAVSTRDQVLQQFLPVTGEPAGPTIESSRQYAVSQGEPVKGAGAAPRSASEQRALRRASRVSRRGGGDAALERALRRAARAANRP